MPECPVYIVSEIVTQKVCKLNSFMIRCFIDRRRNAKVSGSLPRIEDIEGVTNLPGKTADIASRISWVI